MRGFVFAAVVAGGLAASTAHGADCDGERRVYRDGKSLLTADLLINCLERVAMGGGGVMTPWLPTVPTAPKPGHPDYEELQKLLRDVRTAYGFSDYAWSELMGSSMATSDELALVYDLSRLSADGIVERATVVKPEDPANWSDTTQIFLQPDQFYRFETFGPGALK